jgi:hypothetical protein
MVAGSVVVVVGAAEALIEGRPRHATPRATQISAIRPVIGLTKCLILNTVRRAPKLSFSHFDPDA